MLDTREVRRQLEQIRAARVAIKKQDDALKAMEGSILQWLDLADLAFPLDLEAQRPLPLSLPEPGTKRKLLLKDAVLLVLRNRAGTVMSSQDIFEAAKAMGASSRSEKPLIVVEWIIGEARKFANAPINKTKAHHYVWTQQERPAKTHEPATGGESV